jgi:hypothetical protein
MQSYWLLKQLVYIVTTRLWRVNKQFITWTHSCLYVTASSCCKTLDVAAKISTVIISALSKLTEVDGTRAEGNSYSWLKLGCWSKHQTRSTYISQLPICVFSSYHPHLSQPNVSKRSYRNNGATQWNTKCDPTFSLLCLVVDVEGMERPHSFVFSLEENFFCSLGEI